MHQFVGVASPTTTFKCLICTGLRTLLMPMESGPIGADGIAITHGEPTANGFAADVHASEAALVWAAGIPTAAPELAELPPTFPISAPGGQSGTRSCEASSLTPGRQI